MSNARSDKQQRMKIVQNSVVVGMFVFVLVLFLILVIVVVVAVVAVVVSVVLVLVLVLVPVLLVVIVFLKNFRVLDSYGVCCYIVVTSNNKINKK